MVTSHHEGDINPRSNDKAELKFEFLSRHLWLWPKHHCLTSRFCWVFFKVFSFPKLVRSKEHQTRASLDIHSVHWIPIEPLNLTSPQSHHCNGGQTDTPASTWGPEAREKQMGKAMPTPPRGSTDFIQVTLTVAPDLAAIT